MGNRHVIVLAAGKGTRMRSSRPKVLHQLAGQSLIERVINSAKSLVPITTTVVLGHQAEIVKTALSNFPGLRFVRQEPQLGTAHALLQAEILFAGIRGNLLVLSGDVPCINEATLLRLTKHHESSEAIATVLTARLERPFGYGRVIRQKDQFVGIVEEVDTTNEQRSIKEINGGIYVFALEPLFEALHKIPATGPKNERYLPSVLSLYRRKNLKVETVAAEEPSLIRGINSQTELAEASIMMRQVKNEELMAAGVTIEDPSTTYVDDDVQVGADTVIHPGVTLSGSTKIGARCEIHSGVRVVNSTIDDDVTINDFCVILDSRLATGTRVGPFAHLRPGTVMDEGSRVGNFVELKQSTLGAGSKANHLSYVGDAKIGSGVNIGAGTITCNYDGEAKHLTRVEDGVFIGSGTELVAPITIGRGAYVAAGSCLTKDVPPETLGIQRARKKNKRDWLANKSKNKKNSAN
jgi:bifunctional UDP-N-acetylglucosamine pyrophosphorylase/glucosamine-1-phosphate N-acetyltransferase